MEAISQWSYALAAALFGAIAIWQAQRSFTDSRSRALVVALAITGLSALDAAMSGTLSARGQVFVHFRNLAWLGFLYLIWRQSGRNDRPVTVGMLYGVIAAITGAQLGIDYLVSMNRTLGTETTAVFYALMLVRMITMVGGLLLVHNLYSAASPETRQALRLPLIGIAAIWFYDLNLFTIGYLSKDWPIELLQLRGPALALSAPIFALSAQQNRPWTLRLSRTMAFQSISLVAIGGYLALMLLLTVALQLIGGETGRLAQISFVFVASMAALILLPSNRFRAWFRVKVSKHLFQHRYDYRSEWLRFTNTLGKPGTEADTLDVRVIRAIADIVETSAGVLLVPDGQGNLFAQARWNWQWSDPPAMAGQAALSAHLSKTGRLIELETVRAALDGDEETALIPEWMLVENQAWVLVPLVHFEALAGVVLLARPQVNRMLDWEDFDLLRVAGTQVASYLAEARGQEALSDARRFDEFNRRFAFIMHDIKNLVSQLSLLTRNAERHAHNPDFREDMIETLKNSTARMNALLARLSQHNKGKREEARRIELGFIAEQVASTKRMLHPVVISGDGQIMAMAEPARLEQALGHLLQNAIDASPDNEPVTMRIVDHPEGPAIEVIDKGCGMSASYIETSLYKPFASTKDGGFGIGAFEAKSIIGEMGGQIRVSSRPDRGTIFTIILPSGESSRQYFETDRALAA
jgi:putative PEP-CTERM system histidine kinase